VFRVRSYPLKLLEPQRADLFRLVSAMLDNIRVELITLSGGIQSVRVKTSVTVADLRRISRGLFGVSRSRAVICCEGDISKDETNLIDLIEGLVIFDLVDPRAHMQLELQLNVLVASALCAGCGSDAQKYCGGAGRRATAQ